MSEQVVTSSAEFKEGVEAGLDSPENTKNCRSGNELGQQLKAENETEEPLFIRDSPDGNKENAQDEKDETEE